MWKNAGTLKKCQISNCLAIWTLINKVAATHKAGLFLSYLPGTLLISAMANYAVAVHTWVALHQSKKEEEDEVVEALMTDMEVSKLRH